ncbi:ApaLI family restriction endonuclease [Helicobacter felis]
MDSKVYDATKKIADTHARDLKKQVDVRMTEMKSDDNSHDLI